MQNKMPQTFWEIQLFFSQQQLSNRNYYKWETQFKLTKTTTELATASLSVHLQWVNCNQTLTTACYMETQRGENKALSRQVWLVLSGEERHISACMEFKPTNNWSQSRKMSWHNKTQQTLEECNAITLARAHHFLHTQTSRAYVCMVICPVWLFTSIRWMLCAQKNKLSRTSHVWPGNTYATINISSM